MSSSQQLEQAHNVLSEVFGYTQFRPPQADVIKAVFAQDDVLVLMPTGGGKSLCFQVPALVLPGLSIVVSPLIALMQDQVAALQQSGVAAAYLNSSQSASESAQVMRQIHDQQLKLLYIAPERLLMEHTLDRLAQIDVSLIAIDEAHCVSQWGHDFRQDYLGLHVLKQAFPNVPRIALTATADSRTQAEIIKRLALDEPSYFISSFDRPNIRYSVQVKGDARAQLLNFLSGHRGQSGIIYCMSRKRVDAIATWLQGKGFKALPYHAGMDNRDRAANQTTFIHADDVIIVATVAFGMGIDKPDVRFVAHLDLPKSLEAYYQETGRAGRDGLPSEAWMIYGLQDVMRIVKMVQDSNAHADIKRIERAKINSLLGWCEATTCRRRALLLYFAEETVGGCGNCDICLRPPRTWDATQAAQKLLSTIYRTGQRFGSGQVIDVLRGKDTAKVRQFGHQKLSTYGIGEDMADAQWRSIMRQLLVQGYLTINESLYGAIQLEEKSRELLRGEIKLYLREDLFALGRKEKAPSKVPGSGAKVSQADEKLWTALKEERRKLALATSVPPYQIFHDATLMEMMEYRPKSAEELLQINGVGQHKLDLYGAAFLAVIEQF